MPTPHLIRAVGLTAFMTVIACSEGQNEPDEPPESFEEGCRTDEWCQENMPDSVTSTGCVDGICEIRLCFGGSANQRADCDGDWTNGCETQIANNDDHCGGCGVSCGGEALPNMVDTDSCFGTTCGQCMEGWLHSTGSGSDLGCTSPGATLVDGTEDCPEFEEAARIPNEGDCSTYLGAKSCEYSITAQACTKIISCNVAGPEGLGYDFGWDLIQQCP